MAEPTPIIGDWLRALGLGQYLGLFEENEVTFEDLKILSDADLKELGLPFGPRKRLLGALAEYRRRAAPPPSGDSAVPPVTGHAPRVGEILERRQLTVLFCDMVGFTDLAGRVDAETLQSVIHSYEHDCTESIERFGGYILHSLGDGIVALFGFPAAHEGEAERAIRAGLRIVDTMARLEVPEIGRLRVRVGIASGMVVVSAAENRAIGESLNLAARLQGYADPDTVVVTEQVRRLAGATFDYADRGEVTLKGIARPIRILQVIGERTQLSRFEASAPETRLPLVGRATELDHLMELWQSARDGAGRMTLIRGEPGIGKSRLVAAVQERITSEGGFSLSLQCSPLFVDSAFHPFITALERTLDGDKSRSPGGRLEALESLVVGRFGRPIEDVRHLGTLLSLPCQERYGPITITPQRRKEATIRALVDLVESMACGRSGMVLFEDLHWADPTTLEVLEVLAGRIGGMRLLAVLTGRPEFAPRWAERDTFSTRTLTRLSREEILAMVAGLTTGREGFSAEILEQIAGRTDGVPLFVEELTRSLLEQGAAGGPAAGLGASDNGEVVIPTTLRDLLMARLDRVAAVREIAQIGSVIGREFRHDLIGAVATLDEGSLNSALSQLVDSGLAFQHGTPPAAVYTFKHALVQDAAYDSLLKSRRKELHASIARILEERFPESRERAPELLARHYTEAGETEPAVNFWHLAGELAMRRFAHREASAHLRKGLSLVDSLPPGPARNLKELELRTLLGPAVVARHGWTAPEIGGLLEPALALATSLRHSQSLLPTLHGLWVNSMTMGRLTKSRAWAERMLATAASTRDSDLQICGHRAAMTSAFWLGDLVAARRHGDVIRARYDAVRHGHLVKLTNSDPLTGDGIYRSQYLWMLGYPDQALEVCMANHVHARRLNHPFDLAFALTLGSQVHEFRGEPARLLECAAEGERVGREHSVPVMSEVLAEIAKGIAWLRAGQDQDSVAQLRKGLERIIQTGQMIWVPYLRALLAEALGRVGQPAEALKLLDQSLAQSDAQDERPHFAEVLRIKGVVLLSLDRASECERILRDALDYARRQQAHSWELRVAISLARHLNSGGNRRGALEVLEPAYAFFTEGFATRDLREARQLLRSLGHPVPEPAHGSGSAATVSPQ
ncbi:MAG: AAA family ATPase [Verrucomicrobia bacterium]|nr:AAA family ATPase [Verrucomicrobiota bacterium]